MAPNMALIPVSFGRDSMVIDQSGMGTRWVPTSTPNEFGIAT